MTDQPQPDAGALKATADRGSANSHVMDDQILMDGYCIAFSREEWTDRILAALNVRAPEPAGDGEMLTAEGFAQRALAGDRGPASPTDNRSDREAGDVSQAVQRLRDRVHTWRDGSVLRQDILTVLAALPISRPIDVSDEMARFEVAYPLCDHAKHRAGEVVAGRVRYAEPEIDKMFSAWLSRSALNPGATK